MPPADAQSALFGAAFPRLLAIALQWTRHNQAEAEDLAQQALLDAFALPSGPPADLRGLVAVAATLMKGRFLNDRRAAKKRRDPRWLPAVEEQSRGLRRTPEQLAATRELKDRVLRRLSERLADDVVALGVVEATAAGYEKPAEQAAELGVPIEDIRTARKRVSRALDAVKAEEGVAAEDLGLEWEADEAASFEEDARDAGESESA